MERFETRNVLIRSEVLSRRWCRPDGSIPPSRTFLTIKHLNNVKQTKSHWLKNYGNQIKGVQQNQIDVRQKT